MVLADGTGLETPGPTIAIPGKYFDLPVQEALDKSVSDSLTLAEEMHRELMKNPQGVAAGVGLAASGQAQETADLMKRALPLLVNALYYLSDPPKVPLRPGSDTPEALRSKLENPSTPNAGRKAASAMFAAGYTMVRLCGEEFETEAQAMRGSGVKAHWRRGHFRDQRHGPGFQQVKRIWIRPVKVSAGESSDLPGHVYRSDVPPPA